MCIDHKLYITIMALIKDLCRATLRDVATLRIPQLRGIPNLKFTPISKP